MKKRALHAFVAVVTLPGFLCDVAGATEITFGTIETSSETSRGDWVGNFSGTPQDYADRVAAFSTASGSSAYHDVGAERPSREIEESWGPPVTAVDLWNYDNGSLSRVILPYNNGRGILEIILTADPIYEIKPHRLGIEPWNTPTAPSISSGW